MSIVDARNLRKIYGPQTILDDANLALQPGERVGLVGVNGSGKSTLGRILAGSDTPDAGELSFRRGARVAYLPQVPAFDLERTALEEALQGLQAWHEAKTRYEKANAALAADASERWLQAQAQAATDIERLGGWEASHKAEALLMHLGLRRLDAKLSTLSGGERRRAALARALVSHADLLILDEPTNHLDLETVEWLEGYLADTFSGALLLITHDRYLLDRVAQRTLELEQGRLYSYEGGYGAYLEGKAERLAHQARAEGNRQNFLRQELQWLRRGPKARSTKQKARIDRAHAALAVETPTQPKELKLQMQTTRSGKAVLELDELSLRLGDRLLIDGLTLHLTPGERLGVLGPNGSGKTSMLRCILGELEPLAGRVVTGKNVRPAYLSQTRSGLDDDASILENVAGHTGQVRVGEESVDARAYLERFHFRADKQRQPVSSLSGGERTRVALAKLLAEPANLLLLDEPTNDLDVSTLGALEQLLLEQDGTALVITHDRWFLDRIATGILLAEGDGRWIRYEGDYTTVRALRQQAEQAARVDSQRSATTSPTETTASLGTSNPRDKSRKRSALTYAERLELERIVADVEAADAQVSKLEEQLADPEVYQQHVERVPILVAELEATKAESLRLMARWEHLEAKKESSQDSA